MISDIEFCFERQLLLLCCCTYYSASYSCRILYFENRSVFPSAAIIVLSYIGECQCVCLPLPVPDHHRRAVLYSKIRCDPHDHHIIEPTTNKINYIGDKSYQFYFKGQVGRLSIDYKQNCNLETKQKGLEDSSSSPFGHLVKFRCLAIDSSSL